MAESEMATEGNQSEKTESPDKKKQGLEADAFHNFLQGKRHLLVQDYVHAVDSLADACELYVKHYGETAVECGEVYYHYGLALFRLFQQQAGILGDVLPEGSEEEEDDDNDDDEDEGEEQNKSDSEEDKEKENVDSASNDNEGEEEEAEEEDLVDEDEDSKKDDDEDSKKDVDDANKNEAEPKVLPENTDTKKDVSSSASDEKKSAANEAEVGSSTEVSVSSDSKVVKADSSMSGTSAAMVENNIGQISSTDINEAGPSTSQPKPKSEDISDLQLAWETLETAKSIFKRQDSNESQLKVADILLIVAEISMELENYISAVDDLQECLHIREHLLAPDDRSIAETYYQLALAYTYDSQVKPALENYEKSMHVIQLRIKNLKNQTEVKKTPEGFDIDPQDEIDELEGLLPEIKAKMEDTQDMMQDARKVVKEMAFQKVEEVSAGSSPEKPVTNISHLLKRKKPEDSDAAKPIEVKKIKLISVENGDAGTSEMQSSTENASPPKA